MTDRAKFETWWKQQHPSWSLGHRAGNYYDYRTDLAWNAFQSGWQAGHAALAPPDEEKWLSICPRCKAGVIWNVEGPSYECPNCGVVGGDPNLVTEAAMKRRFIGIAATMTRDEARRVMLDIWHFLDEPGLAALAPPAEEIARLRAVCDESNAVCACGCPVDEHERYEEGESCANPMHECLRTSKAVYSMLYALRQENARLLLLAALAPQGDQGWQPIATAPKDGRRLLVVMQDDSPARAWQYEDGDDRRHVGIASWTTHNGGGWVSYWPGTPILWRPLPPGPLPSAAAEPTT